MGWRRRLPARSTHGFMASLTDLQYAAYETIGLLGKTEGLI